MTAANIKRGQTFRVEIPLTDEAGNAYPLTDYTIASEARYAVEGAARDFPLLTVLDTSTSDLAAGIIVLKATAAETNGWPVGEVLFDVFLTAPSGDVIPMPTYRIKVIERVTGYA